MSIDAVKTSTRNAKKLLIDDKKWRQRSIALGESGINFTSRNNSMKPFMSAGMKFSANPLNQESTFEFERASGLNTTRFSGADSQRPDSNADRPWLPQLSQTGMPSKHRLARDETS